MEGTDPRLIYPICYPTEKISDFDGKKESKIKAKKEKGKVDRQIVCR